ncbi:helix-turn-helix domain-containing protein [Agromyces bauzanensis]
MPTSTEYRRAGAGIPASKGVLAPEPGDPGIAPHPAAAEAQATSDDAPIRLTRFAVDRRIAHLVRHVWVPRWRLPPGVVVRQGVLEYPSANLVVEAHAAGVYGPALGRGDERLEGSGWAFGALLQPGVARRLTSVPMRRLVGGVADLHELRVHGTPGFVADVRRAMAAGDEASALAIFERWIDAQEITLDADATLVRDELGLTPKWLIRRYRMQEAAAALAEPDPPSLADLAASLGFADQAHLTREFRAVIGETPRRYARRAGERGPESAPAVLG